jgi:hypothetical protein
MKEYTVLYGTTEKEIIKAVNLLAAQKQAHKRAAKIGTIVIHVILNTL